MREKLQRFMLGRYGNDAFNKFLFTTGLILWILDMFIDTRILYSWAIILLVYGYFRMFSRNVQKRYQENLKFLQLKNKVVSKLKKANHTQEKTHRIYKCPTCRQKIRIPKGKGRICITCPKCKTEFTKIS